MKAKKQSRNHEYPVRWPLLPQAMSGAREDPKLGERHEDERGSGRYWEDETRIALAEELD